MVLQLIMIDITRDWMWLNIPSGNQTWLAGKSPNWMEVWLGKSLISMVRFSSTPCLITAGYLASWYHDDHTNILETITIHAGIPSSGWICFLGNALWKSWILDMHQATRRSPMHKTYINLHDATRLWYDPILVGWLRRVLRCWLPSILPHTSMLSPENTIDLFLDPDLHGSKFFRPAKLQILVKV